MKQSEKNVKRNRRGAAIRTEVKPRQPDVGELEWEKALLNRQLMTWWWNREKSDRNFIKDC